MQARKILSILVLLAVLLTGCAEKEGKTQVVLTTGFARDEVFRLEEANCKLPEIMVYLTNTQNQYEAVYGEQIWTTDLEGITLEQNVKDTALARIAQVKALNLLAQKYQVNLSDTEKKNAQTAAAEYFTSLNDTEIELMGVTQNIIEQLYSEYALANKVYHYIIKDINPEISDDEARTITVEHILIKTYTLNGKGQKIPFSEEEKKKAYERAQEICERAKNGEDFEQLISAYNEDNKSIYSFGKGEKELNFEQEAFNLGKDEISDVVESSFGYHIIKCLTTFNREETDANKVKIVEQRKKEVFNQEYDEFVSGLRKNLNDELWQQVGFIHNEEVNTSDFFDVYSAYFD